MTNFLKRRIQKSSILVVCVLLLVSCALRPSGRNPLVAAEIMPSQDVLQKIPMAMANLREGMNEKQILDTLGLSQYEEYMHLHSGILGYGSWQEKVYLTDSDDYRLSIHSLIDVTDTVVLVRFRVPGMTLFYRDLSTEKTRKIGVIGPHGSDGRIKVIDAGPFPPRNALPPDTSISTNNFPEK